MNKNAIKLIKDNLDKIDWSQLSLNENAIELLEENLDKIDWNYLNMNKKGIEIIKLNVDKMNIINLLLNENEESMLIIKEHIDRIYNHIYIKDYLCYLLYKNPLIFVYDYINMRIKNDEFDENIIKEVMKPSRIFKMMEIYGEDYLEIVYG